jgi:peptidoglycan lytic transglycosylase B
MLSPRLAWLFAAALAFSACTARADPQAEPIPQPTAKSFADFLQGVRRDALGQGIPAATIDRALSGVAYLPKVIELDRRQPEVTLTFQEYIDRVVTPARREAGQQALEENRALLEQVAAKYGVEPRFIVALWGVESDYGRRMGGFPEIAALATLAYDGRRSRFFREELLNAIAMVEKLNVDPDKMTGSWAGAMGQNQFMPSSFLAYAVSWRGDGPPDIWRNRADIFASIANYLAKVGWRRGQGWGVEVTPPPGFDSELIGLSTRKPLGVWAALGLVQANGDALQNEPIAASLIEPGGAGGPALLVFDNFRVFLKWNNSSYFACAVGYLADGVN